MLIHDVLGYMPVCFKEGVCKCGVPVNAVEKVIPKMLRSGYGYVFYDYKKEEKSYKEILELKGKYVDSLENNISCDKCWYGKNRLKSTEEYVEELGKLMEKFGENRSFLLVLI